MKTRNALLLSGLQFFATSINDAYPNFVLQTKVTDLTNTKLDVKSFMTIDTDLQANAGDIVKINTYKYTGEVEKVAKGAKNTKRGSVTHTPSQYEVETYQQVWDYFDEEVRQDPKIVEVGLDGMATTMTNDMKAKFFAEIEKTTTAHTWAKGTKFGYDVVVDAIALMNIEDEANLFVLIGNDLKAEIRKDPDFKAAQLGQILFNGQIGTICGIPIVVSKLTPANTAYLATKEAVTCFTKLENELEQERDGEARKNTVITRKVAIIALTDATKAVKITEAA